MLILDVSFRTYPFDINTTMVEEINALDLLKEEMTTEEIHLKVNAIHRMKTVILSIGASETVS